MKLKLTRKIFAEKAFFLLFMFCTIQLFAQVNIEGTVKDIENIPLIGATVVVQGTTIGTVTNQEGYFSITVPEGATSIEVTYVGYLSEVFDIANKATFEIVLLADIADLGEVVVIGYGTQKKKDLTGSIATVDEERLESIPATNIMASLQGSVAGMSVNTATGRPGSSSNVLIRGVKSILASNDPLVLIDGIPGGSINDVHPSNIENIQVLKDAAATSIYGSRAAGGVIIITTKRGKAGKLTVNYNAYYGFSNVANKVDVVDVDEYIAKKREIWRMENSNFVTDNWISYDSSLTVPVSELLLDYEQVVYDSGMSYNWLDEITRYAPIQSHDLTVSGGDEKTLYYLSMNWTDQKGIIYNSGFNKQSIRANVSTKVNNWFKIGTNIIINRSKTKYVDDQIFTFTYQLSPLGRKYEDNGEYTLYPMHSDDYIANPFTEIERKDIHTATKILNSSFLEFKPITGLTYKMSLNTVVSYHKFNKFTPFRTRQVQAFDQYENASIEYRDNLNLNFENLLSYYKAVGKHSFTGTFVHSIEDFKEDRLWAFAKNFGTDYYEWAALEYGQVDLRDLSSYEERRFLESYIGRFIYNYNSKYLLQLSLRNDKSSKFRKENRNAVFPGVSVGWVISEESFMDNVSLVDNLKLRLSSATTGNQAIGYHDRYNVGDKVYYTTGNDEQGTIVEGLVQTELANKDLQWETSKEVNMGVDFVMLSSRLSGAVEYYKTITSKLLWEQALSPVTGFSDIKNNIGSLQNQGVELSLQGIVLKSNEYELNAYMTFTKNQNKILDLDGTKTDDVTNRLFIGKPIGVIYDYEFDGILQEGEEAPYYMPDLLPGAAKVKNNGSFVETEVGVVERSTVLDSVINEADMTIIGQIHPKWFASFGLSFSYKSFDLSMFFNHVHGITRRIPINVRDRSHSMNIPYYTDENPSSQYGRPAWPTNYSGDANQYGYTSYYVDGSYTRLQDVTLAYTLNPELFSKAGISSLRVYVTGQNLFTITDYMGYEPSIEYSGRQTSGSIDKIAGYPTIKSFLFGLNLTF